MALTAAQKRTIQEEARKAAIKRAQIQSRKISDKEARVASSTMKKGSSNTYRGTPQDKPLLSKSETAALGKQSKTNAEIERQRKLAKAGKAPSKATRVGTVKEYKALGKEIELKAKLRKYAQEAAKNQAERAKVATAKAPAKPAAAKSAAKPAAAKSAAKPAMKSGSFKVTDRRTKAEKASSKKQAFKEVKANTEKGSVKITDTPKFQSVEEAKKAAPTPKAKTTAASTSKPQTLAEAKSKAPTPKSQATISTSRMQSLEEAKSKAPKPGTKATPTTSKMQTLEEAKAKAPKPGVKPAVTPEAPKAKAKVSESVKAAASKTKAGKTVAAANKAFGPKSEVGQAVSKSKAGKLAKGAGKVSGKLFKLGALVAAGREVKQVVSGQAEKDFRRIQALENRIAIAKGQKPKYTTTGTNKNLLSSIKTDLGVAANIATGGVSGKTRKDRLAELQKMLKTVQAKSSTKPNTKSTGMTVIEKPGSTAGKLTGGSKYRVSSGDTLSGIASRAGVTLAELRAANPQLKDKGIFRNTGVIIPKKGKMPAGGYTGPVPYKPGKKK